VGGSKRTSLKGFDDSVSYSVTRLMANGDLANFLCDAGEDFFDVDPDVCEAAQRELLFRCLEVGRDVIPQLKTVHRCGWLHGHVKPNNILVEEQASQVRHRVSDWDHSVKVKDAESGAAVAGTEHFEGPEVGSGER
jgi:serine/threonine protein kinase